MKTHKKLIMLFCALLGTTSSQAALIAHYDFTDGDLLDDEQGSYDLTEINVNAGDVSLNPDGSASFPGGGADKGYLEVTGPGGQPAWTVSFWVRTSDWTQGGFKGLFSNEDTNANGTFSWQIDSNGGNLRVVASNNGTAFPTISTNASAYAVDTWHHVVLRKASANSTEFYVTEQGSALNLIGSNAVNPGGLQEFRLGVNRTDSDLFAMDMANVQIYNDNTVDIATLLAQGPQTIPEPSSTALLGLAGIGFILRRRR